MNSNAQRSAAQEPEEKKPEAIEVGDGATRYDWSIAFSRICMRRKYPAIAIAAAMRLVEFPARGTGQCNPRRDTMALELGKSERQVDRGYQFLESHGWIRRKRGGRDDAVTITLLIPSDDADIHHFGAKKIDVIRDNKLSHMNGSHTGQNQPPYETDSDAIRDICMSRHKEQVEQIEQSAPPARSSVPVESLVSKQSAPNGALEVIKQFFPSLDHCQAERLYQARNAAFSRGVTTEQFWKLSEQVSRQDDSTEEFIATLSAAKPKTNGQWRPPVAQTVSVGLSSSA
jgi:hypothetical protein